MKIKSAQIKNYRIHTDHSVTFDDRLTIISGPNESGKSTLVEALHRGLFLRSRTGGAVRERMLPRDGSIPEVSLSLEIDGKKFSVRKVFQGTTKGTTLLDIAGEGTLSGDEADEKLTHLLSAPNALGSNENALKDRWAHLWVWQGLSGTSPLEAVSEAKSDLVTRLNELGGAALSQSELDDKVIHALIVKRDGIYTQSGNDFRTNSEPGQALQELERTKVALEESKQSVARLDKAITDSEVASRILEEKGLALESAKNDYSVATARASEVDNLRKKIEPLEKTLAEAEEKLVSLQRSTEEIIKDRQELAAADAESQACETRFTALNRKKAESSARLEAAIQERDSILAELDKYKIDLEALRDQKLLLQKQGELKKLEESLSRITALREELNKLRKQLESLPVIEKKDIKALGKLQEELVKARSARDALGAHIKHVKGESTVTVASKMLPLDHDCLVTQDADIQVGETLLRVTLGNVSNLCEASAAVIGAEKKLEERLASLGCATFDAAVDIQERRTVLQNNLDSLETRLAEYTPEQVEAESAACRREIELTTTRLEKSLYEHTKLPSDIETLQSELNHCTDLEQAADARYRAQLSLCKQLETERSTAEADCAALTGKRQELMTEMTRLNAGLEEKVKIYGTDEERAHKRIELLARKEDSGQQLKILCNKLDLLQPGLLESDLRRLDETISRTNKMIQDATVQKQIAERTLFLDGNSDPRAALAAAQAAYESAEQRFTHLKAQAESIKYLAELGTSLQKEISKQINKPLEEKAKAYLETVFGLGTTVTFSAGLQGQETPVIEIERPGIGRFTFSELSGGAHEQVGIALRLAMAEVLAKDHGDSLPLILDDAFVNSDPDRVKKLHRMLYLAADHGLQVIVLTCNPSDYATLGAKEIRL